jgi:hypothetical protein
MNMKNSHRIIRNFVFINLAAFLLICNSAYSHQHKTHKPLTLFSNLEGYIPPEEVAPEMYFLIRNRRSPSTAVAFQKRRGAIETGLIPNFIGGANCPEIDSEKWAIDYSHKRPFSAIHKGIDIPQPYGTPIYAVADGTVIGKFLNENNRKGIEIMLRHTPSQTGLPYFIYSQYTHLSDFPDLQIGANVKMGEEVGKTSNTGKMGRNIRRDALHFAILYSHFPEWTNTGRFSMPADGYWMDPNAFYRKKEPYESKSIASLSDDEKYVLVPIMTGDKTFIPENTQRIWPYSCE